MNLSRPPNPPHTTAQIYLASNASSKLRFEFLTYLFNRLHNFLNSKCSRKFRVQISWAINSKKNVNFQYRNSGEFKFLFFSNLADFTAVGMPSRGVPGAWWTDYRKFVKNKPTRGNFVTLWEHSRSIRCAAGPYPVHKCNISGPDF